MVRMLDGGVRGLWSLVRKGWGMRKKVTPPPPTAWSVRLGGPPLLSIEVIKTSQVTVQHGGKSGRD